MSGKGFFSYDGTFYDLTAKFFDLIAISFFWLLGCIPVITAGASFCALYYSASRSVKKDEGTMGAMFWKSFRQNLKPATGLWVIVAAGLFVFLLNIGILDAKLSNNIGIGFMVFYSICAAAVLAVACYGFPALSRFDMPVGWIVKLSLYLCVRHFPVTILLLAVFAGCYVGIFYMPYAALLLPGVAAFVVSYLLDPIYDRHAPNAQQQRGTK